MSGELTFSLIDNPWIIVRYLGGEVKEVSLQTLVDDAKEIESILGEIPSQGVAIFRLVLAIALCSQRMFGEDGSCESLSTERWLELWESPVKLASDMTEYLAEYQDEFDLFDEKHPFMQVPDLATSKDDHSEINKIVADIPDGEPFFTVRHSQEKLDLAFSEAARWLVHLHAYDVAGIKSGALGDPRVKDGKGYPIGTGWLGRIGLIRIVGPTLVQSLLLNMIPVDRYQDVGLTVRNSCADLAAWEREADTARPRGCVASNRKAAKSYRPVVHGPIDLMTWQARRIRLHVEGGRVVGAILAQGDPISPANGQTKEPMTAWRYSFPQTAKNKEDTYFPKLHNSAEFFWQGLPSIIAQISGTIQSKRTKKQLPQYLTAGIIKWAEYLVSRGVLAQSQLIRVHAVGAEYEANDTKYKEIAEDQLLIPAALLDESQNEARHVLRIALSTTEEIVEALSLFLVNLNRAYGASLLQKEINDLRSKESELLFFELDQAFRGWLTRLTNNLTVARREWRDYLEKFVWEHHNNIIDRFGPRIIKGSEFKDTRRNKYIVDFSFSLKKLEDDVKTALNKLYEERSYHE